MKNSNSLCWTHAFRELISNAWVLSYWVKEPLKRVERNFFTNQSCVPQRQEQRAKFVTILKATALDEIALKTIPSLKKHRKKLFTLLHYNLSSDCKKSNL